ncbi:MAG: type II secretion system protein [Proteobacteria bacterium]|nr:type II secretion system protein [Pseudomonadota bacterium]
MNRGFTLLELAIVLTIGTILVPLLFSFGLYMQEQRVLAEFELDVADAIPTLAEELRTDARAGTPSTADGVGFSRPGCEVRYFVTEEAALVREAAGGCASSRGLSRRAESIAWTPGGVEVVLARVVRPERVERRTLFIPVEGR